MCYITNLLYGTYFREWKPPHDLSQEYWGSEVNESQKALIRNTIKNAYLAKGEGIW